MLALFAAPGAPASGSITLHAYAKRADVVCAAYHRKAAKLPHPQLQNFSAVARLARADRRLVNSANRKLRAIPMPSAKRSVVKRWLRRGYRVPALLRALEHAAARKSVTKEFAANQALQTNGAKRRTLAHRLGMRACSQG